MRHCVNDMNSQIKWIYFVDILYMHALYSIIILLDVSKKTKQNLFFMTTLSSNAFIALTMSLGGRKGIHPVKTEWWDAGMVICLGQDADLHMAQPMPLPLTVTCSSKSRLVLPSLFYLSSAGSPR